MSTIFSVILSKLFSFLKGYWQYVLIVAAGALIYFLWQRTIRLSEEVDKQTRNVEISESTIDSFITKNGELVYTMGVLNVDKNQLKDINSDLVKELKDMNIKLKDVQKVTKIKKETTVEIDSIKSEPEYVYIPGMPIDTTYHFKFADDYVSFSGKLATSNPGVLSNVNIYVNDNLTLVDKITYKRRWLFWRRPVGIEINIKSDNPYSKINMIKSYNLKSLK